MPTYEFRCPNGHDFDRFYKTISAAPSQLECPVCGAPASRQLSGGAGLVFKGSGFYLTDYGKNAHRTATSEKKGGDAGGADKAASGDGKAETTSASKPEAKGESKPGDTAKSESPTTKPAKPKTE